MHAFISGKLVGLAVMKGLAVLTVGLRMVELRAGLVGVIVVVDMLTGGVVVRVISTLVVLIVALVEFMFEVEEALVGLTVGLVGLAVGLIGRLVGLIIVPVGLIEFTVVLVKLPIALVEFVVGIKGVLVVRITVVLRVRLAVE